MYTLSNTLNEYSNRSGYFNKNLSCYLKISQKWTSIIGEALSSICMPSFFLNGVLTINVIDSIWAYEISMKKLSIFENIKKETNIIVNELRTRVDEEAFNKVNSNEDIIKSKDLSKEHISWVSSVIDESHIEDKKLEELFYNILLYTKEN